MVLIPLNVRESASENKKNVETHSDVSVLFCEIDNFDEIVNMYQLGKGLIDLLEQFQKGLDLLCD